MGNSEKENLLQQLRETVLSKIETWEDFYRFVGESHKGMLTGHYNLFDTYLRLVAFVVAMKENPDEGDIKKLMEASFRILVMDSKEKLDVELIVIADNSKPDTTEEDIIEKRLTTDLFSLSAAKSVIERIEKGLNDIE
jgi:hypothetical protein